MLVVHLPDRIGGFVIRRYRIARTIMNRRTALYHALRRDWREIRLYRAA